MNRSADLALHRTSIHEIVERNQCSNPRAFWFAVPGEGDEKIDFTLLVDTTDGKTTCFDIYDIEQELADLLGVPVHVVAARTLRGWVDDQVMEKAKPI